MAQLSINKCSFCDNGNGAFYCHDCEEFICQTCKPVHDKFPANKQHTVIDANKGQRVFKPKPVCGDHKKEYVYYCNKCDCLICSDCLISAHSGHPCCDYMNIVDQRKQDVIEIIETIKSKVQIVEDSINTIKSDKLPRINSAADDFDKQANAVAKEIGGVIEHVRTIHATTASDFQNTETEKMIKVRENLERAHNQYKTLLLKFEHVLLEQHGVIFLLEQKALRMEFDNFDKIPDIPEADQIPNFDPDIFTNQIIDELKKKFIIRALKEYEEEIQKLKETVEKVEQYKLSCEATMKKNIESLTQLEKDNEKLKQEFARIVKESTVEKVQLNTELDRERNQRQQMEKKIDALQKELDAEKGKFKEMDEIKTVESYLQKANVIDEYASETNPRLKPSFNTLSHENQEGFYPMSEDEYCALVHFSNDEEWWKKMKIKNYKDGYMIYRSPTDQVRKIIEDKLKEFNQKVTVDVTLKQPLTTENLKMVERELPENVDIYLTFDKKILKVTTESYETAQQAKFKIEVKLGIIKPTGARKSRLFVSNDAIDLSSEKAKTKNEFSLSLRDSNRRSNYFGLGPASQDMNEFRTKEGLKVLVYSGDILHLNVDCIVNAANEDLQHGGGVAFFIAQAAGNQMQVECDQYIQNNGPIPVGKCISTTAGQLSHYRCIIHTVGPRWDAYGKNRKYACLDDLKMSVLSALEEGTIRSVSSIGIPSISSGIFSVPRELCAQQYLRAINEFSKKSFAFSTIKEVHFIDKNAEMCKIVKDEFFKCFGDNGTSSNTNSYNRSSSDSGQTQSQGKSSETLNPFEKTLTNVQDKTEFCCICMDELLIPKKLRCGHIFCKECIDEFFKQNPACPSCGVVHEIVQGNQPTDGQMRVEGKKYQDLPGYKGVGHILITYYFPDGVQGPEHPNRGKQYKGMTRSAYLPNNTKGRLVADMLELAFKRRLVFTIGNSRTTGEEGVITWNDIHHKTSMEGGPQRFGYPDDTYLDRVLEELAAKGITKDALADYK